MGNLEGIFRGFFLTHRTKAQKFRGKFRNIFRKKIRGSKKIFRAKFTLQTCHLKPFQSLCTVQQSDENILMALKSEQAHRNPPHSVCHKEQHLPPTISNRMATSPQGPLCRRGKPGRFGSSASAMKSRHFGGECSWILAGKA